MSYRTLPSLLLAAGVAAACSGGGEGREVRAGKCGPPDTKVVARGAEEFVRTAQPRAYRYLIPAGGDTTLPEDARAALQMKGQTFLYPNDSAGRQALLTRLSDVGQFTTMVVAYKGTQLITKDSLVVKFAGHYVPIRGMQPAGSITGEIPFSCQTVWKLSRTVKRES